MSDTWFSSSSCVDRVVAADVEHGPRRRRSPRRRRTGRRAGGAGSAARTPRPRTTPSSVRWRGDVLEAAHLVVLGEQVEQRVEDDVDQPVVPATGDVGEVADRDRDRVAARLVAQPGDHRRRQVDAVDADARAPPAAGRSGPSRSPARARDRRRRARSRNATRRRLVSARARRRSARRPPRRSSERARSSPQPVLSFGEEVAALYDDEPRGDEADGRRLPRPSWPVMVTALELAIGTGRIALPLAARACASTASTCRTAMVARLREQARRRRARRHDRRLRRRPGDRHLPPDLRRLQHALQPADPGRPGALLRERRRPSHRRRRRS